MTILSILNDKLERWLSAALLAFVVGLISLQVFMRYVVRHSLSWSEELTLWVFVWFIWITVALAFKHRKHVRVVVFKTLLSARGQVVLDLIVDVAIIVFLGVLIVQCLELMSQPFVARQTSVVLGMPIPYFYASAPVGAGLSIFRLAQNVVRGFGALRDDAGIARFLETDEERGGGL